MSRAWQRGRSRSFVVAVAAASVLSCTESQKAVSGKGADTPLTRAVRDVRSMYVGPLVRPSGNVLTHHENPTRDGLYVDPAFTRAAASKLVRDTSFSAQIAGPTYAQPLYFAQSPGAHDLLVTATERNEVTAFDATDGHVVWRRILGRPAPRSKLPCGNIDPLGVTGTPVIDPATRTVFLDAMTIDTGSPRHLLFALSLDDGAVRSGWPVDVGAKLRTAAGSFDPVVQNQRGALLLQGGTLYVPYGGHLGDCGDFRGWVVGVRIDNPREPFAWTTRAGGGGVWAPSGVASDGASLFVATGNTVGATHWSDGEAIIRLQANLAFSHDPADYFAPADWAQLDARDADLGGTGPVTFTVPGANPSELVMALGKDGFAYLLDRHDLGGIGHSLASKAVASEEIIGAAAAYTTAKGTYVVFKGAGQGCPNGTSGQLTALRISAGSPPDVSIAWCSGPGGMGSPIVTTTDGSANAVVWFVTAERDNQLRGFDGDTGEEVFGGGSSNEQMKTVRRYQSPIVAKGRLFVAGDDALYAFTVGR
jgi:hypothetical protein